MAVAQAKIESWDSRSVTSQTDTNPVPPIQDELYHGKILLSDGDILSMPVAERFRLIRARIERRNLSGHNDKVIAVTSAVPEEGKSLTSVNLARAFATNPVGKTLLVDCDLRKPSVHRYFGLRLSPGMTEGLVSRTTLTNFACPITRGLHVIPAGAAVEDPLRLFETDFFEQSLKQFRETYNYVIIDCPPVLLCPEPVRINSLADGTLIVMRGWQTEKRLVRDAVDVLERKKLIGAVINDGTDSSRQYRYYRYYGYAQRPSGASKKLRKLKLAKKSEGNAPAS